MVPQVNVTQHLNDAVMMMMIMMMMPDNLQYSVLF